MKLNFQNSTLTYPQQTGNTPVTYSRASEKAAGFAQEKEIQSLQQKNVVDEYFKLYDQSYSDVAIKNLIAARLQPSYQLPLIHNTEVLSSKADALLNFSLSI
jgi:hypothetical protein